VRNMKATLPPAANLPLLASACLCRRSPLPLLASACPCLCLPLLACACLCLWLPLLADGSSQGRLLARPCACCEGLAETCTLCCCLPWRLLGMALALALELPVLVCFLGWASTWVPGVEASESEASAL